MRLHDIIKTKENSYIHDFVNTRHIPYVINDSCIDIHNIVKKIKCRWAGHLVWHVDGHDLHAGHHIDGPEGFYT